MLHLWLLHLHWMRLLLQLLMWLLWLEEGRRRRDARGDGCSALPTVLHIAHRLALRGCGATQWLRLLQRLLPARMAPHLESGLAAYLLLMLGADLIAILANPRLRAQ